MWCSKTTKYFFNLWIALSKSAEGGAQNQLFVFSFFLSVYLTHPFENKVKSSVYNSKEQAGTALSDILCLLVSLSVYRSLLYPVSTTNSAIATYTSTSDT